MDSVCAAARSPATNGRSPPRRIERLRHKGSALQFHRDLRTRRDKRGGGFTCRRGRAGVVPNEKAREASTIECQGRGHGCGVVVLKAIEQHITAEEDDGQQAIYKVGRPSGPESAHFAGSFFGEPTAQLFVAVFESSASTPTAHALANE